MSKSQARSDAMKARWKNNRVAMEAQLAKARDAPGRIDSAKLSEKAKAQWRDPSFRDKVSQAVVKSNHRRAAKKDSIEEQDRSDDCNDGNSLEGS